MPDSINMDLCCQLESLLSNGKQMRKYHNYVSRMLEDKTNYNFARPWTPDDIIFAVKEKILSGIYHWDKENCSLNTFFWFRIRTFSYNIILHEAQFQPVKIKEIETEYNDFDNNEINIDPPEPLTPKEFIIEPDFDNFENEEVYIDPLEFTNTAFDLFKDSPEEFCVLDEMYKGYKPRHIAMHLGLNVSDVYNIQQRIKRALLHNINFPPQDK